MIRKELLNEIIISQRKNLEKLDLGIIRGKQVKIEDSFVLAITGIRRCGKSTFLNQLLKKNKGYYLNLEDPRLEGFELSDFMKLEEIMVEIYGKDRIYYFDEIQNIEKWEKFIRYLIDKKEKVVITGSNASILNRELSTKLTGRHLQIEMFPFSFLEFLNMKKEKPSISSFENYFTSGGFPEYLKKDNPQIHYELLSDIVMKDIAVRFKIKNTALLNKLAIYMISNTGKQFSYNSIKISFNVKSVQSVIDYINHFEDAYLIFTIPKFSYSYKKQQINQKKVYSIDNGFSFNNSVSFSKDKGNMLENLVFLALRRKFKEIFYFQEKSECDFIIKEKEKITLAIQVCYDFNEENKNREINGLISALNEFKLGQGFILTYNQDDDFLIENKKIVVKSVWKWLTEKQP